MSLPGPGGMEIKGVIPFTPLSKHCCHWAYFNQICVSLITIVAKSYTLFHENPTDILTPNIKSQMNSLYIKH
jgi:hypothetical protein